MRAAYSGYVIRVTEDSPHLGSQFDPARAGGTVGAGLVPDEVTEGRAETTAHAAGDTMSFENEPTQQIGRPPSTSPLPGPLNVAGTPDTESDTTEVLSLDQLFDAHQQPTPPPAPETQALEAPAPRQSGPSRADRLRSDVTSAATATWARSRDWLTPADTALVAATVLVTLLLLGVVAGL